MGAVGMGAALQPPTAHQSQAPCSGSGLAGPQTPISSCTGSERPQGTEQADRQGSWTGASSPLCACLCPAPHSLMATLLCPVWASVAGGRGVGPGCLCWEHFPEGCGWGAPEHGPSCTASQVAAAPPLALHLQALRRLHRAQRWSHTSPRVVTQPPQGAATMNRPLCSLNSGGLFSSYHPLQSLCVPPSYRGGN